MSNDNKTLADVQPGGRVRLGDQAERARFEARPQAREFEIQKDGSGEYLSEVTHGAWLAWKYLSAQPSPGGQDALAALQQDYDKLLDSFNRQVEVAEKIAGRALQQDDRIEELEEALAARQPVGDEEQPYNLGGIELTACQLHEALLMAGDPELDVPFEDRSLVRIFWTETGHSGPGLYCECVGAEEDGCILLDGTAPAIGRPAQAVDLDAVRALLQRRIEQWRSHLPSDPDAPGTREIETKGEHDYNNDVRIYREGIAVMEEVLSKIDSQAVGK